ncbi:energy-coupling factor ABC transporter substrate-binding protein [Methanobacterium congolense]|jgi:cobalt/nickel transport protein|uniref:Cobalt transport protein CbiN n=1 Tax=Methanobacterium congolense TaxID=118062 RepID=A0A1D3L175_9EURY|nr:energy-coupling factor ABC transporter substrate-binding protein [Methanobacterium congolense]SCG85249.1 Cobalt transport protein CbiN [Methanobacterium congolense]
MVSKVTKRAIILLCITAALLIFPLAFYNGKGEDQGYFSGTDGQGPEYLESLGYHPWINSIWTPPSGEIEVLLFSLQAAIGAIIIGYFMGYWHCEAKRRKEKGKDLKDEMKWE